MTFITKITRRRKNNRTHAGPDDTGEEGPEGPDSTGE